MVNELKGKKFRDSPCTKIAIYLLGFLVYVLSPAILAIIFVIGFIGYTFGFLISCIEMCTKSCLLKRKGNGKLDYLKCYLPNLFLLLLIITLSVTWTAIIAVIGGCLTLIVGTLAWAVIFTATTFMVIKIMMQWLICSRVVKHKNILREKVRETKTLELSLKSAKNPVKII